MRRLALAAFSVALVVVDRFTKILFMNDPALGGSFGIPGILSITQHQNHGVIANIPIPLFVILFMTAIAIIVIFFGIRRAAAQHATRVIVGYSILLSGAVGNLWDRVQWSFVYDWLLLGGRSVINIADICVAIGLFLVLLPSAHRQALDTTEETR